MEFKKITQTKFQKEILYKRNKKEKDRNGKVLDILV